MTFLRQKYRKLAKSLWTLLTDSHPNSQNGLTWASDWRVIDFPDSGTWSSISGIDEHPSGRTEKQQLLLKKKCTNTYLGELNAKWIYRQKKKIFLRRQGQRLYIGYQLLAKYLEIHVAIGIHWSKGTFKHFNW